jgi:hypothetical protein
MLKFKSKIKYNKIDCCVTNCFAISAGGDLYVWGKSERGFYS